MALSLVASIAGDAEWLKGVTAYSMGAAGGSTFCIAFMRVRNFNPWVSEDAKAIAPEKPD